LANGAISFELPKRAAERRSSLALGHALEPKRTDASTVPVRAEFCNSDPRIACAPRANSRHIPVASQLCNDRPDAPSNRKGASGGASMSAKVLIVEDDKLTALGIAEVVTLAGYDVIGSVSSVSEAVDRASVVYPDIAVFDIRLAGRRDGVEGAAILKEMGGAEVVFVSAEQDGETLERARAIEPIALLLKPCHPRELLCAMQNAAGPKRPLPICGWI
jgi:CheY-like chemotaxis protein